MRNRQRIQVEAAGVRLKTQVRRVNWCVTAILFGSLVLVLAPLCAQKRVSGPVPDLSSGKMGAAQDVKEASPPAELAPTAPPLMRASWGALLSSTHMPRRRPRRRLASAYATGARYFALHLEFDSATSREKFNVKGASVFSWFDRFADVFVKANAAGDDFDRSVVTGIINSPGFVWMDPPEEILMPPPPPPVAGAPTRGVPEQIVRGGIDGLTGKGVIIAVIDSGIDFRHADFISTDAEGRPSSRLLYFWDTFSNAFEVTGRGTKPPYSFPNGQPVGTIYTQERLTQALRTGAPSIPATDEYGHGTAAAGLAAGNGRGTPDHEYTGVAPDADLIGVRIGLDQGYVENEYLLNAILAWLDSVAQSEHKPVVVSCSFSGEAGAHDGQTVEERQIQARFASNPGGRVLVVAAGNEQQSGIHARQQFGNDQSPALFVWNAEKGMELHLYIALQTGASASIADLSYAAWQAQVGGQAVLPPVLQHAEINPLSKQIELVYDVPQGWSGLYLWNKTGAPTQADAYILGGVFHPDLARAAELVGVPGTAPAAITVGSYDWNDKFKTGTKDVSLKDSCDNYPMVMGQLSCYSSPGFSRSPGVVKPDIAAPGQWYAAPYAKLPNGQGVDPEEWSVESSGNYILFNGTSAATPYTAGVIALMLQRKPDLTASGIKDMFHSYATRDQSTRSTPSVGWGYGKLDINAVRATLDALQGQQRQTASRPAQ